MPGCQPGVIGHIDVARSHLLYREAGAERLDGFGHGVDVPRRAGHGLRQHPPLKVEDPGRDVARFPDNR